MELGLLRSFLAVADELHFGRAARRLHISQPPLSIQIKKLESDLGAQLFLRTQRRVELTAAGHALLGRARHLVAEAERATMEVRSVAAGQSGTLAIGYAATATHEALPAFVPRFVRARPRVRLELTELRSSLQPAALAERRIELGLACMPVAGVGTDIVEHVLCEERMVAILWGGHPLAKRMSIPIRALDGEAYVGVRPDVEPGWAEASMRAVGAAGVSMRPVQEADTKIGLLGLVAAKLGISVASESMAVLGRRGVVYRPITGLPLRLTLSLLAPRELGPSAEAFLAIARTWKR